MTEPVRTGRVIGQSRVKGILRTSMEKNRMAHAYLFHGPPGVGKDAMAFSMAMGFHCTEGEAEGCGKCAPCSAILRAESPFVSIILPVPSKPRGMKDEKYIEIVRERWLQRIENPYREVSYLPELSTLPVIGIDQIRNLKKNLNLRVPGGKKRIFIISHAERMTAEASNSLLKMLEEPPENTMLILTTSLSGVLFSTIVSRCQGLRFDTLSEEEMETALRERWGFDASRSALLSRISGGSVEKALRLEEIRFEELRDVAVGFLKSSLDRDVIERLNGIHGLADRGNEGVKDILLLLQIWLRDMVHLRLGRSRILNSDREDHLREFIKEKPEFDAEKGMKAVERAIDYIEKNVYIYLICNALSRDFQRCLQS